MAAKLVAEEGILKGLVLSLDNGDQWVIGRDPDACQLLVEDPSASRKHLVCRTTPKGILVENLSETNPIQVNQEEVKEPRLLHNGDAVKIGDGTFRYYAEAAAQLFKDDQKELPLNHHFTDEPAFGDENKSTEIESPNQKPQEKIDDPQEINEESIVKPSVVESSSAESLPKSPVVKKDDEESIVKPSVVESSSAEPLPESPVVKKDNQEIIIEPSVVESSSAESLPKSPVVKKDNEESIVEPSIVESSSAEPLPESPVVKKDDVSKEDVSIQPKIEEESIVEPPIAKEEESIIEPLMVKKEDVTLEPQVEETGEHPHPNPDTQAKMTSSEILVNPSENEIVNGEQPSQEEPHHDIQELNMGTSKPKEENHQEQSVLADPLPQSNTSSEDFPHETSLHQENDEGEKRRDSIYDEEPSDKHGLAEINFGLLDTGRWLLKVINGPNNGAEFSMQTGNSYIIGTDPNACDIVFHDTSVSRQHTRITVNQDDTLIIEDLKSRNGTRVDGELLQGKSSLASNSLIAVGTTSFVVFDREGEMQTIISPLMPSIVKVLQTEEPKKADAENVAPVALPVVPQEIAKPEVHNSNLGAFILIGILTGLFVIVGIGTTTLFKSEPIAKTQTIDPSKALSNALDPFSSVKYSYNPNTGQLLLVGHVLTATDKSQLLYALQGLTFIKSIDDNGVIIDEYVWREINQVLEKNPDWKAINIMATTPGHFIVSGYLQTRNQADRLSEYLSANFPYPDLLEKRTVVDQEVQASINTILQNNGLKNVTAKFDTGEVTLTGGVPTEKVAGLGAIINEIKEIRGIRNIRNDTIGQAPEQSMINVSDKYEVTGISNQGGRMSVVINGRILMKGDSLDGMTITTIQPNVVYLEKDGVKYRIDYNR